MWLKRTPIEDGSPSQRTVETCASHRSILFREWWIFALKMAAVVSALTRVENVGIIFEIGKGGDGKGMGGNFGRVGAWS